MAAKGMLIVQVLIFTLLISTSTIHHVSAARPSGTLQRDKHAPDILQSLTKGDVPSSGPPSGCSSSVQGGLCPPTPPVPSK